MKQEILYREAAREVLLSGVNKLADVVVSTLGPSGHNVILNLESGIPVYCGGPDFVAALIGTDTLQKGAICDRCGSSEGYR